MHYKTNLSWKTGTSYGAKDAWAIGFDANHTIGVWIGRPDNTSMPGNGGRITAGPLLHAIADHLGPTRQPIVKPAEVEKREICWPLGTLRQDMPSETCHKSHQAWIIKQTVPPTWQDKHTPFHTNPVDYWIEAEPNGHSLKRVTSACATRPEHQIAAVWPLTIEPWLPRKWRRSHLLPPWSENCLLRSSDHKRLSIESLEDHTIVRATGNGSGLPEVLLAATGGEGKHHWYINGHHLKSLAYGRPTTHRLKHRGTNQVVVVDDMGNLDKVVILVQ